MNIGQLCNKLHNYDSLRKQNTAHVEGSMKAWISITAKRITSTKQYFAGHYPLPSHISLNYTSGFSAVTSQTLGIRKWNCVWEDKKKDNVLLLLREQVDMDWYAV